MAKPTLTDIADSHTGLTMIDRQVPHSERPGTVWEWLALVTIAVAIYVALVLL